MQFTYIYSTIQHLHLQYTYFVQYTIYTLYKHKKYEQADNDVEISFIIKIIYISTLKSKLWSSPLKKVFHSYSCKYVPVLINYFVLAYIYPSFFKFVLQLFAFFLFLSLFCLLSKWQQPILRSTGSPRVRIRLLANPQQYLPVPRWVATEDGKYGVLVSDGRQRLQKYTIHPQIYILGKKQYPTRHHQSMQPWITKSWTYRYSSATDDKMGRPAVQRGGQVPFIK